MYLSWTSFINYPAYECLFENERETKETCHSEFLAINLNYFMNNYSETPSVKERSRGHRTLIFRANKTTLKKGFFDLTIHP